jgi:tripartite-type tricarboxylate transporter receptor subunit TctC
MQLPRRRFLRTAAGVAAATALPRLALALDYPTRPVRLVIGFSAGSSPDIVARLFGEWLSARLGQTFVIENRPGAGTNIATEAVVRAPPDGYTLLLIASPNMFNTTLYRNLNFNFIRDIAPIGCVTTTPFVMVVNPAVPANSVAEFVAYAKANPGKINMTSTGTGNLTHFAGELFKMMTGIDMVHVPGNSEMQAQSDLLTGRVQVMFDPISSSLGYIKAGKLRALAVTTATRLQMLPDVPTIGEFVPGYEVDGNLGVGAPKGTPDEIIATLSIAINAGLHDPGVTSRLDALGLVPTAMTPAGFAAFISSETEKWAKVIKFANIKTE